MRLQLALNVRDLDQAVDYYTKLFDTPVHKRRPGYANFAIADPPLKLVLFENPAASERLNHLGVEVAEPDELDHTTERFIASGIAQGNQQDTTCCFARQDKIYSLEPDGLAWEWYRITDDDPQPKPSTG